MCGERVERACVCQQQMRILLLKRAGTHTHTRTHTNNASLSDAVAKATKEFKEYAHCLDLTK